jgi:hypothetical protein
MKPITSSSASSVCPTPVCWGGLFDDRSSDRTSAYRTRPTRAFMKWLKAGARKKFSPKLKIFSSVTGGNGLFLALGMEARFS